VWRLITNLYNINMIEVWKDIKRFNGNYSISNCGNVKSITRDKLETFTQINTNLILDS